MTERIIAALILLALAFAIIAGGFNHNQVRERYSWGDRQ
jgi:hypothetical protein